MNGVVRLLSANKPHTVSIVIPGLQNASGYSEITSEMAHKIARALNLLGADRDLLNSDADILIDVIEDYFGNDGAGNDS